MLNPVKDWITRCHRLHKTLFKFTDYKEFMGGGGGGAGRGNSTICCIGTCPLFRGRMLSKTQILGRRLRNIQIFGVEFRTDPRFWGSLLREKLRSNFQENSNSSGFLSETYRSYHSTTGA